MKRTNVKRRGFTIVELLIVIVVIAILAAITTVAYSGISRDAQNTKTVQAVSQWIRILNMYKADHGTFPRSITSCLGSVSEYGGGLVEMSQPANTVARITPPQVYL